MIALFAALAISNSIPLDLQEYDRLSIQHRDKPFFIEFWDPFCGACARFGPIWKSFTQSSPLASKVIFGDVNVELNKPLCKKFEVDAYPSVVYVDVDRTKFTAFDGERDAAGLNGFLEKRLGISSEPTSTNLETALLETNISTVFLLESKDRTDPIAQKAGTLARSEGCRFVSRIGDRRRLLAYKSATFSVEFDGKWDQSSISEFIRGNRFCLLPMLTDHLRESFASRREQFFLVILTPELHPQVVKQIAKAKPAFQMFYSLHDSTGVSIAQLPQFRLIDPAESRWSLIPASNTRELVQQLSQVDINKVKWRSEPKPPPEIRENPKRHSPVNENPAKVLGAQNWPKRVLVVFFGLLVIVLVCVLVDGPRTPARQRLCSSPVSNVHEEPVSFGVEFESSHDSFSG
jgi:thiol-disulfide isomerase/thioredoxin